MLSCVGGKTDQKGGIREKETALALPIDLLAPKAARTSEKSREERQEGAKLGPLIVHKKVLFHILHRERKNPSRKRTKKKRRALSFMRGKKTPLRCPRRAEVGEGKKQTLSNSMGGRNIRKEGRHRLLLWQGARYSAFLLS